MPGDSLRLLAWRQRFCPERTIFPKRIDYHQISSSPSIWLARRRKYPIGFSSLKCALIVGIEDCKSIQKRVQGSWNPDATLGLNCSQAGFEKGESEGGMVAGPVVDGGPVDAGALSSGGDGLPGDEGLEG